MSIVAIVPVAALLSANAPLEEAGHGPRNFSVPAYTGAGATHAALHAWDDPAFTAAIQAIPGVATDLGDGDPVTRTQALIEAQGAKWGANAPQLPATGTVAAGSLYQYEGQLWSVIQTFSRSTYGAHPSTYPALIRRVHVPGELEPWKQPLDQYDAYKLVSPFTGQPDQCTYNGKTWKVSAADASGNNVWAPGVYGWAEIVN